MTTTEYWDEIEERLGTVGLQLSDGDGPHLTVTLPDGNGNPASILVERAPDVHGSKLRRQVSQFHQAFGVPVLDRPQVPSDERVRLRLRLVAEEFCELLSAAGCPVASLRIDHLLRESINQLEGAGDFNLVEFADALGDLDYVIEGTRAEMGIDGGPIADAIHASNMAKVGGPVVNGKITKPQGWTPPDIAGELKKQGWEG